MLVSWRIKLDFWIASWINITLYSLMASLWRSCDFGLNLPKDTLCLPGEDGLFLLNHLNYSNNASIGISVSAHSIILRFPWNKGSHFRSKTLPFGGPGRYNLTRFDLCCTLVPHNLFQSISGRFPIQMATISNFHSANGSNNTTGWAPNQLLYKSS